jgi:hypothetical protein
MSLQSENIGWRATLIGSLIALVVICGTLYLFIGPVGILYGFGFMVFYGLAGLVTKLIRPNADAKNDPVYQANVQRLIKRQSEGKSE